MDDLELPRAEDDLASHRPVTASRRLSHAISDGEGIALIVDVDGPEAARAAEVAGAKALTLTSGLERHLEATRAATALPILFVHDGQRPAALEGADACVVFGDLDVLDQWHVDLADQFELAIRVDQEEHLAEVLDRFDPELLVLAAGRRDAPLEHVLALLSDVPAGKLAIAELEDVTQLEIDELERAGVDAVLLREPLPAR